MKYDITNMNIYSNGAITIDYRKLDDNGQYLGSVANDSNIPEEAKKAIWECKRKVAELLDKRDEI